MEIRQYLDRFEVENEEILIKVNNVNVEKEGTYARLKIYSKIPSRRRIKTAPRLNLQSDRAINELAKTLSHLYVLGDGGDEWAIALHSICDEILERATSPQKPISLSIVENTKPSWHVHNLILCESPNIVFSPGGSGKSFLSLFIGICIQNGISFFGDVQQSKTLYLDWETDINETNRRATLIANGLEHDIRLPDYLRMYAPLADSTEQLLEIITENGYRFMVIDSAACAVGGNINDSEDVVRFFSAIRKINACGVTTLIISHVSKSDKKENKKSSPIGSIFFENFPRIAWELRSSYDEKEQRYLFGLFCRKTNVGRVDPVGVSMRFEDGAVVFERCNPNALEIASDKETIANSIVSRLAMRSMTVKELESELGADQQVIWNTLYALKKAGKVVNISRGRWALAGSEQVEEDVPF